METSNHVRFLETGTKSELLEKLESGTYTTNEGVCMDTFNADRKIIRNAQSGKMIGVSKSWQWHNVTYIVDYIWEPI